MRRAAATHEVQVRETSEPRRQRGLGVGVKAAEVLNEAATAVSRRRAAQDIGPRLQALVIRPRCVAQAVMGGAGHSHS
jgi:hypothetical protein